MPVFAEIAAKGCYSFRILYNKGSGERLRFPEFSPFSNYSQVGLATECVKTCSFPTMHGRVPLCVSAELDHAWVENSKFFIHSVACYKEIFAMHAYIFIPVLGVAAMGFVTLHLR